MIISVGVYLEGGEYSFFIEGVLGSFDPAWLPDLEGSVEGIMSDYIYNQSLEDSIEDIYLKINLKLRTEYDRSTGSINVWFEEVSMEESPYE